MINNNLEKYADLLRSETYSNFLLAYTLFQSQDEKQHNPTKLSKLLNFENRKMVLLNAQIAFRESAIQLEDIINIGKFIDISRNPFFSHKDVDFSILFNAFYSANSGKYKGVEVLKTVWGLAPNRVTKKKTFFTPFTSFSVYYQYEVKIEDKLILKHSKGKRIRYKYDILAFYKFREIIKLIDDFKEHPDEYEVGLIPI